MRTLHADSILFDLQRQPHHFDSFEHCSPQRKTALATGSQVFLGQIGGKPPRKTPVANAALLPPILITLAKGCTAWLYYSRVITLHG
jgi:hypothetical protein